MTGPGSSANHEPCPEQGKDDPRRSWFQCPAAKASSPNQRDSSK